MTTTTNWTRRIERIPCLHPDGEHVQVGRSGLVHTRSIWFVLNQSFVEWNAANVARLGAALAYYSVFSIPPLLLLVIAVASFVFGEEAARDNIAQEIEGTVGPPVAKAIQETLKNNQDTTQSTIATILGIGILIVGAAGVFGQLQDALNSIWRVEPKPGRGLTGLLRDRFASFTMVLGFGFLLLVSLVLNTVLSAMSTWLSRSLPGGVVLWQAINTIVSLLVITILFALIYKVVPDAHTAFSDVWIGAALTAVLFTIGKFALGWYLGQESTTSAYGAAGSLVVILLWVFYASQILLFGAAFTRAYAMHCGSGVKPSENAVLVDQNPPHAAVVSPPNKVSTSPVM